MAAQFISLKIIADRLLRNNLMQGINYEAIIDYTADFMEIVGVPDIFIDKPYEAKISKHKAPLPCDFSEEIQILINHNPAREATDTFHNHYECYTHKGRPCNCSPSHGINKSSDPTYALRNTWIHTNVESGILHMNYRAFMTDEEGFIMIPDRAAFKNALEWFIKWKYYTILWENGELEDKRLQYAEQQYCWAVGQCETDMHRMSLGRAESFFNSFRTLLPRTNEFNKRFVHNGTQEKIKSH